MKVNPYGAHRTCTQDLQGSLRASQDSYMTHISGVHVKRLPTWIPKLPQMGYLGWAIRPLTNLGAENVPIMFPLRLYHQCNDLFRFQKRNVVELFVECCRVRHELRITVNDFSTLDDCAPPVIGHEVHIIYKTLLFIKTLLHHYYYYTFIQPISGVGRGLPRGKGCKWGQMLVAMKLPKRNLQHRIMASSVQKMFGWMPLRLQEMVLLSLSGFMNFI